jgi:Arc/MetJ family transcription regulator
MRTTITIDDALHQQALDMMDPEIDKADVFREAMRTFVRVQADKRLADLAKRMGRAHLPALHRENFLDAFR